jgi:Fe-S-cluster containining protein
MIRADYVLAAGVVIAAFALSLPQAIRRIRLYARRGDFSCRMCGNCCRFKTIPVNEEDIKRLIDSGFHDFHEVRGGENVLKRINGRCLYLADDKCLVHDVRPSVCRNFPFFKLFGVVYARSASFCPAMEGLEGE